MTLLWFMVLIMIVFYVIIFIILIKRNNSITNEISKAATIKIRKSINNIMLSGITGLPEHKVDGCKISWERKLEMIVKRQVELDKFVKKVEFYGDKAIVNYNRMGYAVKQMQSMIKETAKLVKSAEDIDDNLLKRLRELIMKESSDVISDNDLFSTLLKIRDQKIQMNGLINKQSKMFSNEYPVYLPRFNG